MFGIVTIELVTAGESAESVDVRLRSLGLRNIFFDRFWDDQIEARTVGDQYPPYVPGWRHWFFTALLPEARVDVKAEEG